MAKYNINLTKSFIKDYKKLQAKDSTLDTSELESQIDSLVYKPYNLTNDEIKIIEKG